MKKTSTQIGIIPLEDRVLIKEIKPEATQKMKSGFIVPESADKDGGFRKGKVVAVGSGKYAHGILVPMNVKVGDTVLYTWGEKIKMDGEEYAILRETEICAIVN